MKSPSFLSQKRYADNQNPAAKIGFVIFYPFQFYVYKNIYRYLKNEAEFIIDLGPFFPIEQPLDLLADIVNLLDKNKVSYRIIYYEDYFRKSYLEDFFSNYKILISLWERGCVRFSCNFDKRKVSLAYGAGKELTMIRPSRSIYDLILAYGNRDSKLFSLYTQCEIVGNPKFDDWFNDEFDKDFLAELKTKIDKNKKTILYLPTHSDLCSVDNLAYKLKELAESYNINIIVKFHYYTVREEPERVKKLEHDKIILFGDNVDLMPLLKISDVVLSDNSSVIFDAILADKPIIVTDFLTKEFLDVEHKKYKEGYRFQRSVGTTYSGSIEQIIKKERLVLTIKKPEELSLAIQEAFRDRPFFRESRRKIKREIFAFNDGKCGERAAMAVKNLLLAKELPERPIFYHALESFSVGRSPSRGKEDSDKIEKYESLLFKKIRKGNKKDVIFSVLVIDQSGESKEFLRACLRSLFEQNFPAENYEVILPETDKVKAIVKEISDTGKNEKLKIKYVKSQEDIDLAFVKDALKEARGIVCFTTNNYLLPSNWLLNFYMAYECYPGIVGVGGFISKYEQDYSVFQEYYFLELAQKLNLQREVNYLKKIYDVKNNILHQNPAGKIGNISYKKEIFDNLDIENQPPIIEVLELILKKEAMEKGDLAFIPSAVFGLKQINLKEFIQRNFYEGIAFYIVCIERPMLKRYYSYNLFSPIKLMLMNMLDGYWRTRLPFVVFIGSLFRLLGGWYAFISYKIFKINSRPQGYS